MPPSCAASAIRRSLLVVALATLTPLSALADAVPASPSETETDDPPPGEARLGPIAARTPSEVAKAEPMIEPGGAREVGGDGAPPLTRPPPPELPTFGLKLDAGVPDGINGALVVRPFPWLRLHAGGGYNLVSAGLSAGLALIPFDTAVAPSLTLEGGHYFEGDANGLVGAVTGERVDSSILRRTGYDYANLAFGLEFGRRYFTFFIHAGFTYLRAVVHAQEAVESLAITVVQDPVVTGIAPAAKLGIIVYVY